MLKVPKSEGGKTLFIVGIPGLVIEYNWLAKSIDQ